MSNPAPSLGPATGGARRLQQNDAGQGWMRWLPDIATLRDYRRSWLHHDLVAGLVLVTMLVPVGIAYAVASGVPGVCGLYATIVPLLAYAVFGPSRILVLGPDSSLAPIILAVVVAHSAGDPMRAIALAGAMAIVSGLICILAGVLRLGFVTELFSKPIRYGYMNGIALTVLISQLPKLFGFSVDAEGPVRSLWAIGGAVWTGRANWTAFFLGAATLATILLLKGSKRVPAVLIAVIGATLVVSVFDLSACDRSGCCGGTGRQAAGCRHRDVLCRAERSGQGQAEALRTL
jgi:MFS superfamily sulfate permease-like transporter